MNILVTEKNALKCVSATYHKNIKYNKVYHLNSDRVAVYYKSSRLHMVSI